MSILFEPETIISVSSLGVTMYFWFVQANRERPNLRFFQISPFRTSCRKIPGEDDKRRLCVQQIDAGVLVANNSIRQNSIILFDCWFAHEGVTYRGDWGYVNDDKPPWNIGPESSISMGLACFFDVPPDFEVPDDFKFSVSFVTASGQRFVHEFYREPPNLNAQPLESETEKRAA